MNYGVMFSIQAQHTAKICEVVGYEYKKIYNKYGVAVHQIKVPRYKKTLEVRKTRPKLQTPFKGFIYETKGVQVVHLNGCDVTYRGRGKVIGEFICDYIWECPDRAGRSFLELNGSCLSLDELNAYSDVKTLYGIQITELVIFKTPKSLREFRKPSNERLNAAPQSWQYVRI